MIRLVLVSLFLVACGNTLAKYDYAKEPDPRNQEIILGVGDVVGINVWDQKDLNTEAVIRPDGTITMPLVGDIKAAGQTPSALKERIKQQLANFLKMGAGNEVTVAVRAWKSYRFTIEGEVTRSGVFSNDQYVTVSEALAMAGGLSRFAKHDEIKLMRHDKRGYREIPLDYDALASGSRPDMNIYVMPGDQIYVP
ncbi:MAG TPA: polysaccharide biosynthesis/export family protein [Kofleriaceae bacterium]|jgi:polysaccharide export outer membrane protein